MGVVDNIRFDKFPKQGDWVGASVSVCFAYDTAKTIPGVIVRDDMEAPWETIIRLEDERFVRASECQYSLARPAPAQGEGGAERG